MESDSVALAYLLNLLLENTYPTDRFLGCAMSHITQELSLQQKEQYQVRPKKGEHPAKNILAS